MADEFLKNEPGIDLRKDPMALQRLKQAAEKAKIELSSSSQTDINEPYITAKDGVPKHLTIKLTRAEFERLVDPLVQRSLAPCKQALSDSGLSLSEIDEVILVGGSTRIPRIQQAVEQFFGKKPNKGVNPDEVVAIGAAIQGGVLTGEVKDVLLLDVTALSFGIETMGGVLTKIIESNTTIPTKKTQTFSTATDSQPSCDIHILQGERALARDNRSLGRFNLDGIPAMRRGEPKIEVTLDIDANGILNVSAKELSTGVSQQIRIEAGTGLSKEEIERMKNDAKANEESDREASEKIQKLNEADQLVFQSEKQLEEMGAQLAEEAKTKIQLAIGMLRQAHASQDLKAVEQATTDLNAAWTEASNGAYNQQGAPQGGTAQGANQGGADDVQDADFEEVK
jgi:molecular chaperone DnaK